MDPKLRNLLDAFNRIANLRQQATDEPYGWGKLFNAGFHLQQQIDSYFKEAA